MKFTFKSKLYIGFAIAIIASATSGLTSYIILEKQDEQRQSLRHLHAQIDTVSTLQKLVTEMEAGRRGFRSTNEKRFLATYNEALSRVPSVYTELKTLTVNEPLSAERIAVMEQHIDNLIAFYKYNGDNAEAYTRDYITKLTEKEKKQTDEINGIITAFEKEKLALLTKGREEHDKMIAKGIMSAGIASIVSILIIILLIWVIVRQYSKRTKLIEELQNQSDILRDSEMQLKNTMDDLVKINKQLEKFVYTVAHDIKNPLSGIISAMSLIKSDETLNKDSEIAELTNLSMAAAEHLAVMVNSLLEYSTITLSSKTKEVVNVDQLLEEIAILLFPPKNIEIKIANGLPVFNTWKLKMVQVFQNLLSNAIKYNGKEKGLIEIGYADKGGHYEFFVKDNGQGIAEEDKNKVFTLLGRGGNKSITDSSTGFGLNIVKLIVEEQGGNIWYDSVVGKGSTFYFEWMK